jgi:poly-gamma-glutamate capsule biosynthesis protein CapA/YwtB (metallophosphatase superfamily)
MDCGIDGLSQTINSLQKNDLNYFGAGLNTEEANKPLVKQFILSGDTITIAVFSGFEYRKSYDSIYNFYAGENSSGVNVISVNKTAEQIKEYKQKYPGIYIIFFPHWGRNYLAKTEMQTETAHGLIDAGVDLIIGTGAHTIQQIESYKEKLIIYCIGNSVFNAPGRYKSYGVKPYSFITSLEIRYTKGKLIKQLRLYPIYTDNLKTDYQVRFLDEDEFADYILSLEKISADKNNFTPRIQIRKTELPYSILISLNY